MDRNRTGTIRRRKRKLNGTAIRAFAVVFVAAILATLASGQVFAQTPTPTPTPNIFMNRADAQRNIIDPNSGGDLVFSVRYELPKSTTPGVSDAWCVILTDQTGCDQDPAAPTVPTSLSSGIVFLRLRNVGISPALIAEQSIKRIDHSLAVLYLGIGHGVTFADPDIRICIETINGPLLTVESTSCTVPSWSTSASDGVTQRSDLGVSITSIMRELEQERDVSFGLFLSNAGLITQTGQVFTKEQLIPLEQIIPQVFQAGASQLGENYLTPLADSSLSTDLATAASTSTVGESLEGAAQEFAGMAGSTVATFAMFGIAAVVSALVFGMTKDASAAALGFMSAPIIGISLGAPHLHVLLTALFVMSIPATIAIMSRVRA